MSDRGTHELAAAVNVKAATALTKQGGDLHAWVPTIWFYVGIQLIEAALADYGEHLKEHGDRLALLVSPLGVKRTALYRDLQILSTNWRYRGLRPSDHEVAQSERWAKDLCGELGERWPG